MDIYMFEFHIIDLNYVLRNLKYAICKQVTLMITWKRGDSQ